MNARKLYPVGKQIEWPHPADGHPVQVKVISYDVSTTRKVESVNVKGADFSDGAAVGRLETDGSGLK